MIEVTNLRAGDREQWEVLARGYKSFYRTVVSDAVYDRAWRRLLSETDVFAFVARQDDRPIGLAHYLFHANVWMDDTCYLQDLFVQESARGRGAARMLIERVAQAARDRGAPRLYWTTQEHNATARALYDKIGKFNGFIRYDYRLE